MDDLITTFCGDCGKPLEFVRPGKWQCNNGDCLSNNFDWSRLNDKEYLEQHLTKISLREKRKNED